MAKKTNNTRSQRRAAKRQQAAAIKRSPNLSQKTIINHSFEHLPELSAVPQASLNLIPDAAWQAIKLKTMQAAGRYFMSNVSYGPPLSRMYSVGVVGTGDVKPKVKKGYKQHNNWKTIVNDWVTWCDTPALCDFTAESTFTELLTTAVEHLLSDGEIFFRVAPGAPLKLEAIDPGRVPSNQIYKAANYLVLGVEHTKNGVRTNYLIQKKISNQSYLTAYDQRDATRLPAKSVLHFRLPARVGAVRGWPLVATITAVGSNANSFGISAAANADAMARRIGIVKQNEMSKSYNGDTSKDIEVDENGEIIIDNTEPETLDIGYFENALKLMITNAPTGVDFSVHDGKFPSADTDSFIKPLARQIAGAMSVTYHGATADTEAVNFAAGKLGRLEQEENMARVFKSLVNKILNPVWRRWIARNIMAGTWPDVTDADFNELVKVDWMRPPFIPADVKAQAAADNTRIDNGTLSRQAVIEANGYDYEVMKEQIENEQRYDDDRARNNQQQSSSEQGN